VKLQAWIPLIDAGVGHVLEPIAHTQISTEFETYAHMTNKLNGPPKVFPAELMLTQKCSIDPSVQQN
jgi:hypothetical protein